VVYQTIFRWHIYSAIFVPKITGIGQLLLKLSLVVGWRWYPFLRHSVENTFGRNRLRQFFFIRPARSIPKLPAGRALMSGVCGKPGLSSANRLSAVILGIRAGSCGGGAALATGRERRR